MIVVWNKDADLLAFEGKGELELEPFRSHLGACESVLHLGA